MNAYQLLQTGAKVKIRQTLIASAFAVLAMGANAANAKVYDWSFIPNNPSGLNGPVLAAGQLTTGTGLYEDPLTGVVESSTIAGATLVAPVTGGYGVVANIDGFQAEPISLYGAYSSPLTSTYWTSSDGAYWYDNALFPLTTPHVDNWGLLFTAGATPYGYPSPGAPNSVPEFNIFNSQSGYVSPNNYPGTDEFYVTNPGGGYTSVEGTFVLSVPEPATWALLLLGFFGIGFMVRGSRRQGVAAVA